MGESHSSQSLDGQISDYKVVKAVTDGSTAGCHLKKPCYHF